MNLISVIIPYFNKATTINRSVESVLCQTYSNWELIILDDCSEIPLINVVKYKDPRIKILYNQSNLGPGPTRQRGLDTARGEFVAFLDADDWWDKFFLEKALIGLLNDFDSIASWCQSLIYNSNGSEIRRYNELKHTNLFHSLLIYGHSIQTSAFLWRKSKCGEWGILSTNQDSFFEYACCKNGTKIFPLNEILLFRDETGDEHRSKYVTKQQQYINNFYLYIYVYRNYRNSLTYKNYLILINRILTAYFKVRKNTDFGNAKNILIQEISPIGKYLVSNLLFY